MTHQYNFNLVLFGGTGDLVTRKIVPAILHLLSNKDISPTSRFIATGRTKLSNEEYSIFLQTQLTKFMISVDPVIWNQFNQQIYYLHLDVTNSEDYKALEQILVPNYNNIYYLATAPTFFNQISQNLALVGINHLNSRIVLEKPLGHDLLSSKKINDYVAQFFNEQQIFRIDHYLGKESVQNLMAIRFGNTLFEALWRRQWIQSVQITIAEDIGVGSRAEFYDNTGALRDMLQNHLLQLLCIVAMEPPANLEPDTIRNEKLKVLQSLKPLIEEDVLNNVIKGQYKSGALNGIPVKAYREEEAVPHESITETFVAVRAEIQNWRWAGVPFYLRTGKRLQEKLAEIVIQFKDLPCNIFPNNGEALGNKLLIQLQPDETIQLYFQAKKPGDTQELHPVYLDLNLSKINKTSKVDGYERLLHEIIINRLTLFVRKDEAEAAWNWVSPIINTWNKYQTAPKLYSAGTWGPASSTSLLAKDGYSWHEESL